MAALAEFAAVTVWPVAAALGAAADGSRRQLAVRRLLSVLRPTIGEQASAIAAGRHPCLMNDDQSAIFFFDSANPASVTVYPDLEWARGSLESLDVEGGGGEPAFTATGRVVRVESSADLFATFEVTEQVDLERLQAWLRKVKGPAALADDPPAYAHEWIRLEELDAQRPPFLPERLRSWYRRRINS